MEIRDRIKELRRMPASELKANPRNWRKHGDTQRAALRGILDEVGIADAVLARELPDGSVELIDGHLRRDELDSVPVPVLILDVTQEEADKLLATFDQITGLAGVDRAKLGELVAGIEMKNDALIKLLGSIVEDGRVIQRLTIPGEKPRHECHDGQLWHVGEEHRLIIADVFTGWPQYMPFLCEGAVFIPYAGPMVPLTEMARRSPLVMVQPVVHVAGVLLDWYVDAFGPEAVKLIQ